MYAQYVCACVLFVPSQGCVQTSLGAWAVGWDETRRDERAGKQAGRIGCVKAHVRQIAGGSGAIRRYGRRAVNGKQPGSEGVEREKDVRIKPRRIKAR